MLPSLFQTPDAVLNIAHRGASGQCPENTLPAFKRAIEQNADMVELDVQLTKDNVPVIFHDTKLNNHSSGTGAIADYMFEELRSLDAGSWFDAGFAGEKIPSLEEILQLAQETIALNIEIKTEAVRDETEDGVEERCLELVKRYSMEEHVLFSSFDPRAVRNLKQLAPQVAVAVLYSRKFGRKKPSEITKKYSADAFNCSFGRLNESRLSDLKAHRIPFFVYTVDQPARMKQLIKMGVSGIFTNRPDVLSRILRNLDQDGRD